MSFCGNCGNELGNGSAFCIKCGCPVDGQKEQAPAPKQKKRRPWWLIIAIAELVIAMVLAAVLLFGKKQDDRAKDTEAEKTWPESRQSEEEPEEQPQVVEYIDIEDYDDGGECGGDMQWGYDADEKLLVISGTGRMRDYEFDHDTRKTTAPWAAYADEIEEVRILYGPEYLGAYAFWSFDSMVRVTISNSVETIGEETFALAWDLTSVTIPDSVTTREEKAFFGGDSLQTVTLPASVTDIGFDAFSECGNLRVVYYQGSEEQWDRVSGNYEFSDIEIRFDA